MPYDARRAQPYSIYPDLNLFVAVAPSRDVYDRYLIRLDEMRQSIRILKQIRHILEETKRQLPSPGAAASTARASLLAKPMAAPRTRRAS